MHLNDSIMMEEVLAPVIANGLKQDMMEKDANYGCGVLYRNLQGKLCLSTYFYVGKPTAFEISHIAPKSLGLMREKLIKETEAKEDFHELLFATEVIRGIHTSMN